MWLMRTPPRWHNCCAAAFLHCASPQGTLLANACTIGKLQGVILRQAAKLREYIAEEEAEQVVKDKYCMEMIRAEFAKAARKQPDNTSHEEQQHGE